MRPRIHIAPWTVTALLTLGLPAASLAQWVPGGIEVSSVVHGDEPQICTDGHGGAFVTWRTYAEDIFVQHLTVLGTLAPGWPASGVVVIATPDDYEGLRSITSDEQGGAFVVWYDTRSPYFGNLYAQKIVASAGAGLAWPTDGVPLVQLPGRGDDPFTVADGAGGAFFFFSDGRNGDLDIYAQHLTAQGTVADGWPTYGLPVCVLPSSAAYPRAVSDGGGGVLVCWNDNRNGPLSTFGQHLTGQGAIAEGWPVNGREIVPGRYMRGFASDGAGGAYVGLAVPASFPYIGFDATYYVLRITGAGTPFPGWPPGGVNVCDAPVFRDGLQIISDGLGGAYMQWTDVRDPVQAVYALRLLPDGSRAPGWSANGSRISSIYGYQNNRDLIGDDAGGAYFAYDVNTSTSRVYVQHMTGSGIPAPGFTAEGTVLTSLTDQYNGRLTKDGAGGAIVAWENAYYAKVYAQRFVPDGPVAVEISLASAEATADRVAIAWLESGDRAPATLYRSESGGEWSALTRLDPDGEGFLRYEDRGVTPGSRYGYRLGVLSDGIERLVGEITIDVPASAQFALLGVSPNPALRDLNVSFSLAGKDPATLELIDIAGRRITTQAVGALGAGNHVVNLGRDAMLPAGVYLVALTQGTRSLTTRAVVVR